MSSIRDIMKTEEEAAAILAEGQKKAEEIKRKGKEEAARILEQAASRKEEELASAREKIIREETEASERAAAETKAKLAQREAAFESGKEKAARDLLMAILEEGA